MYISFTRKNILRYEHSTQKLGLITLMQQCQTFYREKELTNKGRDKIDN